MLPLATAIIGILFGAAFAGSVAMLLIILLAGALTAAGILSVSILVGFYKKSATAAFRTFTFIVCIMAGIAMGLSATFMLGNILRKTMQ